MKKLATMLKVVALISLAMFLGGGCDDGPLADEMLNGGSTSGGTTGGNASGNFTGSGGSSGGNTTENTGGNPTGSGDLASDKVGNTDDTVGEEIEVNFDADDEILACFNLVNDFRTSGTADYATENGGTKKVGKLDALTLDEELCKAAAIRAEEIVKDFSHTRPNGSSCFTVLKECGISYSSVGENIAAGKKSGEETFLQWKEDGKPYSGQGHRRNMLGVDYNFTKIGLAYAYAPNSTYNYYWVMILTK